MFRSLIFSNTEQIQTRSTSVSKRDIPRIAWKGIMGSIITYVHVTLL